MQQRQLRLGDVLDDYCPRERRLTNHVVVAMVGNDVKQTRCTTCDAEHEYKQARLPRLRRKADTAAIAPGVPKLREPPPAAPVTVSGAESPSAEIEVAAVPDEDQASVEQAVPQAAAGDDEAGPADDEGPVHRPLIRASLPRLEGAPPPARPATDFTIRQPAGNRHNRFRPRHAGGGHQPHQSHQSQGNRSGGYGGGGGQVRGGGPRHGGGQPQSNRSQSQHGQGRKRSR
jgi:uncharacterized membrane protein YgcG